jgi:hypothetical protein
MLNTGYLYISFVLQMITMAVDELHFHRLRGLPRWERIGHPLDTLTVLACFAWLFLARPQPFSIAVYVGLSVLSCLFVTKDEPVHRLHCSSGEHWLHAVMFTLHPLILTSAGLLWPVLHERQYLPSWIRYTGSERAFMLGSSILIAGFGFYQFLYWNILWQPLQFDRPTIE